MSEPDFNPDVLNPPPRSPEADVEAVVAPLTAAVDAVSPSPALADNNGAKEGSEKAIGQPLP